VGLADRVEETMGERVSAPSMFSQGEACILDHALVDNDLIILFRSLSQGETRIFTNGKS
jgi:hypothetical protein